MIEVELDVHTHTLASGHAYGTIREMAQAASDKGLKILGITEHAKGIPGTCDDPVDIARFDFVTEVLKEIQFPDKLIINKNAEEFKKFILQRRK